MGKKAYIGVGDKARTVKNIYVGVGGKARKVLKGYVGVGGKARQFWPARNPWNPYAGQKLVFDHDYQPDTIYTRHHAGIEETIRWSINKTIFYNRGIGDYEGFLDLLESKTEEIIDYIMSQALPSDNTVFFHTDISSAFHNVVFNAYLGYQPAASIRIVSKYDGTSYPRYFYDTTDTASEGESRVLVNVKLSSDGNLVKTTTPNQRGLTFALGNDVDDVFATSWGICYQNYVINTGIHFESFNSGDIVANWDYTQSLYDTVEGLVGCRDLAWGISTRDSSGLHLNSPNYSGDYIKVPSWCFRYANTMEMTLKSYDRIENYAVSLFGCNKNSLYLMHEENEGYWKFMDLSSGSYWSALIEPIGISDLYFFQNSTVKIHYDEDGKISLYKNGSLVYKTNTVKVKTLAQCGNPMSVCGFYCTITKLKFYNE